MLEEDGREQMAFDTYRATVNLYIKLERSAVSSNQPFPDLPILLWNLLIYNYTTESLCIYAAYIESVDLFWNPKPNKYVMWRRNIQWWCECMCLQLNVTGKVFRYLRVKVWVFSSSTDHMCTWCNELRALFLLWMHPVKVWLGHFFVWCDLIWIYLGLLIDGSKFLMQGQHLSFCSIIFLGEHLQLKMMVSLIGWKPIDVSCEGFKMQQQCWWDGVSRLTNARPPKVNVKWVTNLCKVRNLWSEKFICCIIMTSFGCSWSTLYWI